MHLELFWELGFWLASNNKRLQQAGTGLLTARAMNDSVHNSCMQRALDRPL